MYERGVITGGMKYHPEVAERLEGNVGLRSHCRIRSLLRLAAGSGDHFSDSQRVRLSARIQLRESLVVVSVAIQDHVCVFCVEKVPPGADVAIFAAGQPGPVRLMPVGQDARLGCGVEVVVEPHGFRAGRAAASHRAAVRVEPDDVPAAEVEGEVPTIAQGVGVDPEIPEVIGSGGVGGGTRAAKPIGTRHVFMVSGDRKHLGVQYAPAWSIAQRIVIEIAAGILHVTQAQNQVHAGVGRQSLARPELRAAVGRSVAAVKIRVVRVTSDVSGCCYNRIPGLAG